MLTFEKENHIYRWNGQAVPSVSEIIRPIIQYSGSIPDGVLEAAADRGHEIHQACEDIDKGEFYDPKEHDSYVEAYQEWKRSLECSFVQIESPLYSEFYGYAGTPDRIAMIKDRPVVIDIKSTVKIEKHSLVQLTAYSELFREFAKLKSKPDGYILQLKKNGSFKFEKVSDLTKFWNVFLSCLNIHKFNKGEK